MTWRPHVLAAAATVVALTSGATAARADTLHVEIHCAQQIDAAALTDHLALELAGTRWTIAPATAVAEATLAIDTAACAPDAPFDLAFTTAAQHWTKRIDLASSLREHRARELAIVIADLVQLTPPSPPSPPAQPARELANPAQPADDNDGAYHPKLVPAIGGALIGGTFGASIALGATHPSPTSSRAQIATGVGVGGAVVGAIAAPWLADHFGWTAMQVRTATSATLWSAIFAGMFSVILQTPVGEPPQWRRDIGTGTEGTTLREGALATTIGAGVGAIGGGVIASRVAVTESEIDSFDLATGVGTVGGFVIGQVPRQDGATNSARDGIIGEIAGAAIGAIVAPYLDMAPRRTAIIAGGAALGAVTPLAFYYLGSALTDDIGKHYLGAYAALGLVAGATISFLATRPGESPTTTAPSRRTGATPPSLVERDGVGAWRFGGVALGPLSRTLDDRQRGTAVGLVSGAF